VHDADVSGDILRREVIPKYFDPLRYPASEDGTPTEDPETGGLAAERFTKNL
jgi:hypothetical protein